MVKLGGKTISKKQFKRLEQIIEEIKELRRDYIILARNERYLGTNLSEEKNDINNKILKLRSEIKSMDISDSVVSTYILHNKR